MREEKEEASMWQTTDILPQEGVVLGFFPDEKNSRRITTMQIRNGRPWVVGAMFAFDLSAPTHWMPLPSEPEITA